jgi:hypothetical protein
VQNRLRYLPLAGLKPGMVLAKPLMVVDRGMLSEGLAAGHVLTQDSLAKLASRHAELACVHMADLRSTEQRREQLARAQARLAEIFREADMQHAPTLMLYRALLDFRASL